MECRLDKPAKILFSMCDNTLKMSIPSIFTMFMDIATEHGPMFGVGHEHLAPKGLFWLTVRTKIKILDRPEIADKVTLSTWPEKPGRVRTNRYYSISDGQTPLVVGKTEWAVINLESGKLHKIDEIYPDNLRHCEEISCDEPFIRISEDFENCKKLDTYTVRSTDIDLGQHMNNAAYVRVLFGAFSCEELQKMNISVVDVAFRSPCYEGEELSIRCRKADKALDVGIIRSDGTVAAVARLQGDIQ